MARIIIYFYATSDLNVKCNDDTMTGNISCIFEGKDLFKYAIKALTTIGQNHVIEPMA